MIMKRQGIKLGLMLCLVNPAEILIVGDVGVPFPSVPHQSGTQLLYLVCREYMGIQTSSDCLLYPLYVPC